MFFADWLQTKQIATISRFEEAENCRIDANTIGEIMHEPYDGDDTLIVVEVDGARRRNED